MKFCREAKRIVPDTATVCPIHHTDRCLSEFGGGKPASRETAGTSPPAGDDATLRSEVLRLEGQIHAAKRRGWTLTGGIIASLVTCFVVWLAYHASVVGSYAVLEDDIRLTRDAVDPSRVAVLYRPRTSGSVGFTRADAGRDTELLDRVSPETIGREQKLEWRWTGVNEGDVLRATYRQGWRLKSHDLRVPAAPKPTSLGAAAVSGRVVDATNNKPLLGAIVRIAGTSLSSKTDAEGRFRLSECPEGPVGIKISAEKFCAYEVERNLQRNQEAELDIALSPGMARGQLRIVLKWNAEPKDLDAHLDGPLPNGERFHVFFADHGDLQSQEFVSLDRDCVNGRGPETITVLGVQPGRYHYCINDFKNNGEAGAKDLARSGAKVELYQGDQMLRRFTVNPNAAGNLWNVCDIEVSAERQITVHKLDNYKGDLLKPKRMAALFIVIENSDRFPRMHLERLKAEASNELRKTPWHEPDLVAGIVWCDTNGVSHYGPSGDQKGLLNALAAIKPVNNVSLPKQLSTAGELMKKARGMRVTHVLTAGLTSDENQLRLSIDDLMAAGGLITASGLGDANLSYLRKLATLPEDARLLTP